MNRERCPKCGKLLIEPVGPKDSKILLVGEFPGQEESERGIPFCGPSGDILKSELMRVRLPFVVCRATNLWTHRQDEKECDANWHANRLGKEMRGKKVVLFMGSELSKMFFDCGIMDISGLEVPSELFPGVRIFASPNPATAAREAVGELRLAIERFAEVASVL
jgi:uracil-DNA glycosylase family 4